MSFFDQIKASLFPDTRSLDQGKKPILLEIIKRTEQEQKEYNEWLLNDPKDQLIQFLWKELTQAQKNGSEWITRLNGQGMRGFLIHGGEDSLEAIEARHLLDYWKSRILELNYKLYTSASETYLKKKKVLLKEKYYFKAYTSLDSIPKKPPKSDHPFQEHVVHNQEYGNILLETETYDGTLLFIKCTVTTYAGFNYSEPKKFDHLMQFLFKA